MSSKAAPSALASPTLACCLAEHLGALAGHLASRSDLNPSCHSDPQHPPVSPAYPAYPAS